MFKRHKNGCNDLHYKIIICTQYYINIVILGNDVYGYLLHISVLTAFLIVHIIVFVVLPNVNYCYKSLVESLVMPLVGNHSMIQLGNHGVLHI